MLKNIDCGRSLEPSRRGGSNEYPQSMFWAEIWKKNNKKQKKKKNRILSENFQFYLNRRVFVMENATIEVKFAVNKQIKRLRFAVTFIFILLEAVWLICSLCSDEVLIISFTYCC